MEDVSDPPSKNMQNLVDLMYTEFISSEGLIRDAGTALKNLIFLMLNVQLEYKFLEVMKNQ